jgi:TonB-dependent receptor
VELKKYALRSLLLTFLVFGVAISSARAANELIVYVFQDGSAAAGLEVYLDGELTGRTRADGSLMADLSAGGHSLELREQDGASLYNFRFESARGQLADAIINLDAPEHRIEIFAVAESGSDRRGAPTGTLSGRVASGGVAVANALVRVVETGETLTADSDGSFSVTLPRGSYQFEVSHPTNDTSETSRFRIVSGVTRGTVFDLPAEGIALPTVAPPGQLEEVFVLGSFDPGMFEVSERDTNQIVDTLGLEELARFADTNVAASVVRVPSVTVQDNRFVFIRGLGGRYISTTLNGATMPSTDPARRTVPLDLFPSNFVNQLDIKKTFLPSMPGESTGGNLVINTRTFPDQRSGQVQLRVNATNGLTGENVFTDPSDGGFDWAGWDAGERELDQGISAIADILNLGTVQDTVNGTTFEINDTIQRELQRLGALLISEDLDLDFTTAWPDVRVGGNYGDIFYVGDAELGAFAAINYENGWTMKDEGENNTFTPSGDGLDLFSFQEYTNFVDLSGLLSLGMNIGNHTFESNTLVSRSTESRIRRTVGREGDEFQSQYRNTIDWIERQYISQQIVGSHTLNDSGSLFAEWQITASQARRDAPDRREVTFSANQGATPPETLLAGFDFSSPNDEQTVELNNFFLEPNALVRRFDELVDANFDLTGNLSWDVVEGADNFGTLMVGFQAIYRERDSDSETYGFNINQQLVDSLIAPNVLVSEIITQDTITGDPGTGFAFQDKTLASDSYDAELEYNSVFASYDHTWRDTVQVVAGLRLEDYVQTTETFSLQGAGDAVTGEINELSVLPSLSFNWFYSDDQQLRVAVSKTVARPDFKESANATFYDTEFDFRVRGNPNLEISDILNVDARWEWYFSDRDSVSAALFYKDMDKPIERIVQPASGTAGNSRTFDNADTGELYGIEVEGRKEFDIGDDYSRSFFVALNASLIESEVSLSTGETRKLQGQPDYTFNLVLGYDDFARGQQLTLLVNQNGESIKDVGILGNPDVIEEPRLAINLVYRWDLNDNFSLRAKINNLLNDEIEFTQGGQTFQAYTSGTEFQLGVDWSF